MNPYKAKVRAVGVASLRTLPAISVALMLATTAACDRLLSVDNPGRVPAEALADPALMPTLEAAALQQFQCAFGEWVGTTGMLSGEYLSANGFVNNHPWEWRGVVQIKQSPGGCVGNRNATSMGFYTPLQQARFQLDDLAKRANEFTDEQLPTKQKMLAEARAYAGYAYTLLTEGMCDIVFDNGPIMPKADAWKIAEEHFTEAITLATALDDASLKNMALVGRARTRLDLGDLAGAAADAALVSDGFVRNAEYSETTPSRENRIYNLTIRNVFLSAGPEYRNLTLEDGTTPDPRVNVKDLGRLGDDNNTEIWQQQKYTGSGAVPLPIATWAEAQLILAEAKGGQEGLDAINRVRAASGVPALVPPPGSDFTTLLLEERRRQLFSQGNRYVDMLRYDLPFPTGVNRKGQVYSDLTCVPLPDVETQNNPNLKGG